nr:diacylglycerol kinase family protein [Polymorphobacter sp.]
MKTLWLVLNTASGSTSAAIVAEFEKSCADYTIAGRTEFPAEKLPDATTLDAAGVDTLVVFGGDGTINAATCKVEDWGGTALILPGGTMNGLAKALHGDIGWAEVLKRAPQGKTIHVPVAICGEHRAMVGVILGPASSWFHAREYVRSGAWSKLTRALRYAARKTFARTIRVVGEGANAGRHRAVIVTPRDHDLEIAAISTGSWFAAARLGWSWLLGDWREADGVTVTYAPSVDLTSSRQVSVLFDGEPAKLHPPVHVEHALTRLKFIATKA